MGVNLRGFSIMRGYTQEFMAGKLNVAQNTYSKYENNGEKLPIEILEKIATVLGVSVTDITTNTPIIISELKRSGILRISLLTKRSYMKKCLPLAMQKLNG